MGLHSYRSGCGGWPDCLRQSGIDEASLFVRSFYSEQDVVTATQKQTAVLVPYFARQKVSSYEQDVRCHGWWAAMRPDARFGVGPIGLTHLQAYGHRQLRAATQTCSLAVTHG